MTKQKHIKAVDAASNAEELLPLEQMMVQGGAPNEGAAYAVDDANQDKDSEHHGTESKGASLVPKLRFAGFTESWRSVYLKDVVTSFEYGLNAPAKDYDFFTKYLRITDIDEDSRKFLITDLKSPDIEAAKASDYLAQDGDLFFARTASVGRTYLYSRSDGRVVFAGYLIRGHVRQDLFSPVFIFYSTLTTQYEMFVAATSARSVQPGINAAEYGSYQFAVPSIAEQQRIGSLFKELDHNIELNRGLLEKLTQLKKSMLEQMFPREGESVPRLRFAGFTEPWKTDSFEQVFSFLPKVNIAREQLSVSSGCVKNIHYGDILTVFGDVLDVNLEAVPRIVGSSLLPKHDPFLLQNGDVVIADTAEDSSAGKVIELTGVSDGVQVIGGQHTMPCRPCVKFSPYFLGYLLNSSCFRDALVNQLQGIKVLSISKANLSVLSVKFPDSLAEQQRIGEFFKALDQRIAQQRAKLEKLGQLKKALLEQMFV